MTQKATLEIVHMNLECFVSEVVKAALDGWELDTQTPPMQFGVLYTATLLKDENLIEPPKASRAEVLGNARAAKKAKAKASAEESTADQTDTEDALVEQPEQSAPAEDAPAEDAPAELSDEVVQVPAEA